MFPKNYKIRTTQVVMLICFNVLYPNYNVTYVTMSVQSVYLVKRTVNKKVQKLKIINTKNCTDFTKT